MHSVHLREAATDALFTIARVMLHFNGQAVDRLRMACEFIANKTYLYCLTFYVASTSAWFLLLTSRKQSICLTNSSEDFFFSNFQYLYFFNVYIHPKNTHVGGYFYNIEAKLVYTC